MSGKHTKYNPREIEARMQQMWADSVLYKAVDLDKRPRSYVLVEYPYPSGEGLHVGHCLSYIAQDIVARAERMQGKNVLYPIGWDAFGLPAENFAIQNKVRPQDATKKNIANFKRQIKSLGISFDWSREINTTDPKYYKWTQWIFLQLFKHGLAEKKEMPINWCPSCKIGLAFEEVVDGKCERCGHETNRKFIKQWVLKITKYADRLIDDLDTVDFLPEIKQQQINWIGRSEGAEIDFDINFGSDEKKEFLFLHAYKDSSKGAFWPWLKKEVEGRGHTVTALDLPNTNEPNIDEQVQFIMDSFSFSENSVIVTHSLGGVAAMKLLPLLKMSIDRLILVSPPLRAEFLDGQKRPVLERACDWNFDFSKIKKKAHSIIVLADDHDHIVPRAQMKEIAQKLEATFILGHGTETHYDGTTEPDVLQAIFPRLKAFTTRPDTLFGATYMVVAPEHPILNQLQGSVTNWHKVHKYIERSAKKTDRQRQESKEKTGLELEGIKAVNHATQEEIPIWVADYVMSTYGTGAIMAVPAHDERDHEFAKKYKLPIIEVIKSDEALKNKCWTGEGELINSGKFNGLDSTKARTAITKSVGGQMTVQYKLRDWIFSRQHYWGEPIPIINCGKCGHVPLEEKDLPLELPEVKHYEPTNTGDSPLAKIEPWVNVKCPKCGGDAKRETDTMPTWAGSSWYFLRYTDPHNDKELAGKKKLKYWLPVDLYNGGAEHNTLHLLYSRFWHKFLYDIKAVPTPEPYRRRVQHGMILGPDSQKMSKSRGNVISPDHIVEKYGADVFRLYMMFMGEYDKVKIWSDKNLQGVWRFMNRLWNFLSRVSIVAESTPEELSALHGTIKRIQLDLDRRSFNTTVSHFMIFLKTLENKDVIGRYVLDDFTRLFAPFAPHVADEIWQNILGHNSSVHYEPWPELDESYIVDVGVRIGIQVNGKVRADLMVTSDMSDNDIQKTVLALPQVKKHVGASKVKKFIYIKNKIISIVI